MKIRVALFYDQYSRDWTPLVRLKDELEKYDAICRIAPSGEMLEYAIIFKPDAIVIGNPDLYHGEYATLLSNKAEVFSIPTEQSIFDAKVFAERVVGGHNKNNTDYEPPSVAIVSKFFLWSEFHKDTLLGAGISPEKLFVSGSLRLSIPENGVAEDGHDPNCVGVALETEINKSLAYDLWALDGLDSAYGSFLDYYTLDVNILHAQLRVIRALIDEGYHVIVRPRLDDRSTDYSFLGENVEIDLTPNPSYLLNRCSFIVTGQSTIGLEAYLYGTKVISVIGMVNQTLVSDRMKAYLSFQHPVRPKAMEELLQLVRDSSHYRQPTEFVNKIRFYFGANISRPETRIAEEILRVIKGKPQGFTNPTTKDAIFRISKKFRGLRGVLIKNKDNDFGVILSLLILARRLVRNHLGFGKVRSG